jgi:hypothetical protein
MPKWLGYERMVNEGAKLYAVPKPPWWKPFQRYAWRKACVSAYLEKAVLAALREETQ